MSDYLHGIFKDVDSARTAHQKLLAAGVTSELISPYPLQETHPDNGRSPVRKFSLTGAILGFLAGITLTIYSATSYILPTGGRAVISVPPFLLVSYELTILFAVIGTLIGFLYCSGLPAWHERPHHEAAGVDELVVSAEIADDQEASVRKVLQENGADRIEKQSLIPIEPEQPPPEEDAQ